MFVCDLRHFLDVPPDAPAPAHNMARRLGHIVKAATAGEAGSTWVSALGCSRRPGRRPCPGRIAVYRSGFEGPIDWHCISCGDEGTISGWEGSPFDLRPRRPLALAAERVPVVVSPEIGAALREVTLLDTACERLVFGAQSVGTDVVLSCDADDLEELLGYVAAEANHEENRRRQQRFDDAFAVLDEVARTL